MMEPVPAKFRDNAVLRFIYHLIDKVGMVASLIVFILIAILLYGVIMRYAVGAPSVWVSELSGLLYACYFLVGGAYALIHNEHVNVNIFRARLSERHQAMLDLVTWIWFYLMMGVLFWLGIKYAYASIIRFERSSTVWGAYVWPVKLMLPVSALLMLLGGAIKTYSDIRTILRK